MPAFQVRAAVADGTVVEMAIDATTHDEAVSTILKRGGLPIEVVEVHRLRLASREMSAGEAAAGFRILARMLSSGLPLTRALAAMDLLAPASWRALLPALREGVRQGQSVSGTLNRLELPLPAVARGMIQAGEAAGDLAGGMTRTAAFMEATAAATRALRAALAYPALLAVTGTASLAVMLTLVLPRFEQILTDLGEPVPPALAFTLGVVGIGRAVALPLAGALLTSALLFRSWVATPEGRAKFHNALLRLPLIGSFRMARATAVAFAALAALLRSGMPAPAALRECAQASGDAALAQRIEQARTLVLQGSPLAGALRDSAAATPTSIFFVAAAEESGDLAAMVEHAAAIEQERADRMITGALRLTEPTLILMFAAAVAVVAAAMLQALYGMRPAL
jgi:general secretion pathway protein F